MSERARTLSATAVVVAAVLLEVAPRGSHLVIVALGICALAATVGGAWRASLLPMTWFVVPGSLVLIVAVAHSSPFMLAVAPASGAACVIGLAMLDPPRLGLRGFLGEWLTLAVGFLASIAVLVVTAVTSTGNTTLAVVGSVCTLVLAAAILLILGAVPQAQSSK